MHRVDHRRAAIAISLWSLGFAFSSVPAARAEREEPLEGFHYDTVPARELMALVDHPTVLGWWKQFADGPGVLRSVERVPDGDGRRVVYTFIMFRDAVGPGIFVRKEFTVVLAHKSGSEEYVVTSVRGAWHR